MDNQNIILKLSDHTNTPQQETERLIILGCLKKWE